MRVVAALACSAVVGFHAPEAGASEAGRRAPEASVSLARHHTTNALDAAYAVRDWYTVLRGSVEDTLVNDLGTTRFAAELDARRYDTYGIENDVAVAAAAETTLRPSDTLELRGTLSLNLSDEGDDLALGDTVIGTRLGQAILAAAAQAGIRIGPDTTLVVEGLAAREIAGKTRFQDHLLPPIEIEPDRTRLGLGARLMRSHGPLSYGGGIGAELRHSEPAGIYAPITIAEYTAKLIAALNLAGGAAIGASAGVQMLRLADTSFREIRPTYELSASLPLPAGFSLTASLKGAYDTRTRDDPVASRLRRAQIEAAYQASPTVRLGAGVFAEERENLALGDETTARGLYGQAAWQPWEKTEITVRVDAVRRTQSAPALEWRAIDAQVAISRKL